MAREPVGALLRRSLLGGPARENVALNGAAELVRVEQGSLADLLAAPADMAPWSLVAVNILANVIVAFFEQGLAGVVAPGGLLILSGFLQAQTPQIRAQLRRCGLEQLAQETLEEWACIIARRP